MCDHLYSLSDQNGSSQLRDKARRFITLVDELYNARTRLVCTAACAQDELFSKSGAGEEPIVDLEQLQFESAVEGEPPCDLS